MPVSDQGNRIETGLTFDPWPRWREIMRDATRRGRLTRERIAELLAQQDDEFVEWAVGEDEELRQMVEALREERRAGRLF